MTDNEIKALVKQVLAGEVFGSWQMTDSQIKQHGPLVFLPVALGAGIPPGVEHAFAPYSAQVGTRGINGWPCFSSVAWLSTADWDKFKELYSKALKAQQEALNVQPSRWSRFVGWLRGLV